MAEPRALQDWRLLIAAAFGAVVAGLPVLVLAAIALLGSGAAPQNQTPAPRVCVFSRSEVLAKSILGQKSTERLQQLVGQANNQLASDRQALADEVRGFGETDESLSEVDRATRQQALQQRQQAIQIKAQQLDARLRHTRTAVTQRVNAQIDPLLEAAYKERGCSILLERSIVLRGDQGNDLTPAVISALNEKASTISFDLLPLPQQPSEPVE